jgi:hypothetical protein
MNEQELRDGLRGVVAASSPPPPMNPNTALDTGRRAHRRRRARWAGAGAAVAVTALAAGAVLALNRPDPGGVLPVDLGSAPAGSPADGPDNTKPSWPNGQKDRTATNGPQAQRGVDLLNALTAALPGTLVADPAVKYPGTQDTVTNAQAQFLDKAGEKEIWDYLATTAVTTKAAPKAGTGRVIAEVYTPGKLGPDDMCDLARTFWGVGGDCTIYNVQGKQVGVVTKSEDPRIGQVAAYRYSDGTVVFAAQSKDPDNGRGMGATSGSGEPASMAELPLTVDQLAALTLTPAFKIS